MKEKRNIQITAGRGPAECAWVVAQVLKFFLLDAKKNGINTSVLNREKGMENGTVLSALVSCEGDGLEGFLSTWVGTIQWIGQSTFRKYHKRKNWFIGLSQLDEKSLPQWDETKVTYQTMRSSGPGGQNTNKVSTAVRAIYTPTGAFAFASDSRSQFQNKKLALSRLKEKVQQANLEEVKNGVQAQWGMHLDLERGNPIKVFKGTDFKQKKENLPVGRQGKTTISKKYRLKLKNELRKEIE